MRIARDSFVCLCRVGEERIRVAGACAKLSQMMRNGEKEGKSRGKKAACEG